MGLKNDILIELGFQEILVSGIEQESKISSQDENFRNTLICIFKYRGEQLEQFQVNISETNKTATLKMQRNE